MPDLRTGYRLPFYTLITLTSLLYIRLLGFDFVTWDDHTIIVNNPIVQTGFSNWQGVFDIGTYARFMPLAWVSFKTVSALMGMDPAYFHFSNVLLHLINSALLYGLIYRVLSIRAAEHENVPSNQSRHWITFSLVIFWSWHPLRVEPVAWATGLTYNVSTLFFLGSLLALVRYQQLGGVFAAASSVILLTCSLATYPPAITWPAAIPLVWILLENKHPGWKGLLSDALPSLRKSATVSALSLTISGAFLSLTLIGRFMGKSNWYSEDNVVLQESLQLGLGERLLNCVYSTSGLFQRMLLPLELSPAWPPAEVPAIVILSAALMILALAIFVVVFAKKSPRISIALIVVGITAIPVVGLTEGIFHQPDRYAHILQLVGVLIIAMALPLRATHEAITKRLMRGMLLIASCALLLAWLNYKQQDIWRDSYTLFEHLKDVSWVKACPIRSAQVQLMHARKLTADKRYAEAAEIYWPLLQNNPHPYKVIYYASINYMLMGNNTMALKLIEAAAQVDQREEILGLQRHLRTTVIRDASPSAE